MAKKPDSPDLPTSLDEALGAGEAAAAAPPEAVQSALDAMGRLCSGELEYAVGRARLAGLDTAVVLAVTPGGLVPLFAHVTPDIFPVLVPVPRDADPKAARASAAGRLN
jgi:hypothetical protein